MAIPITVPRLGWNMEEGRFAGWLRPDGATIHSGEPLFSLESDKTTEEIEALDPGVLRHLPDGPRVGDMLAVGAVIGYLLQSDDSLPGEDHASTAAAPPAISIPSSMPAPSVDAPRDVVRSTLKSSPRARRLARQLEVDLHTVPGTGRTGRIRERDVRAAVDQTPRSSIQRLTAERMLESHRSTAPVTLTTTADATHLVDIRKQFQASGNTAPSYTDLLVKLAAAALVRHPRLNARWEDNRVMDNSAIHIGIAVDTEQGLVVPVIRDVPALGIRELAAQTKSLIERARRHELSVDGLQGGTFTITNLGAFGIDAFTPLINCPQCAILGVGRIRRRPAVVGDLVAIREEITLSLTFDHRIVDGAPAARFLQTLSGLIDNPGPVLAP